MYFPVSEIECLPFTPFLWAVGISFFCSMGGISGAFLLMPLQISVLGITQPCVSATNHMFNLLACPSGVYRFWKEGRLIWPLALVISSGTVPGVFIGAWLKTLFLQNMQNFKLFVGVILLYIGVRMALNLMKDKKGRPKTDGRAKVLSWSFTEISVSFQDETYKILVRPLFLLSASVGVLGGIYGIGGGAIMAPFLVTSFGLPVYITAGATLFSTFMTSLAGVSGYLWLSQSGAQVAPDWALGFLFGLGGIVGMYLGARCQMRVPSRLLKAALALLLICVAIRYLI